MCHLTKLIFSKLQLGTRLSLLVALCLGLESASVAQDIPQTVQFNRDIRRILANKCFACHGPDEKARKAKLRFDQEDSVFQKDAKVIVRGKPGESELIHRIDSDDPDVRMPPASNKKPLTDRERELLRKWIAQGAKWEGHWSFIPPQRPTVPQVDAKVVRNDIDRFIVRMLDRQGLQHASETDRVTLVRRLYFDLLGLPPTFEQVQAFVGDKDPKAVDKLIEQLLQSPHFGERMAIYWLDVVRFADSNGYHSDEARSVGPYRDYVIDAFNKNKPFDQFTIEQLAGDLIPEASQEQKIASGFNMMLQTTSEGGAQAKEYLAKYSADRVRNTSSIFLGVTMGCAECHNHKFDPFTQKDFYNMAAFFADISERGVGNPTSYPVETAAFRARLQELDSQIAAARESLNQTPVDAGLKKWEASVAESGLGNTSFGAWHVIGPFAAASFDAAHATAFPPEQEIDLKKTYGKLAWRKADNFVDGKIHTLVGGNSAHYLVRTINADQPSKIEVSIGSDDSFRLWVNGALAGEQKVLRAVTPDQNKVTVNLKQGENTLLFKVVNGGGGYGFYFKPQVVGLPANIVGILKTVADKRTDKQQAELAAYYRGIAPELAAPRLKIQQVTDEKKKVQGQLPKTLMTVSTTPRTIRLLNRGNWMDDSGPEMQPNTPGFMKPLGVAGRRANRLDLAKWVVSRDNPLTARTFVNRLWQRFYGKGLATPLDDLGFQGSLPSHPELLDWLAVEFIESGWDVKHMVRLMVSSGTYRQSSVPTAQQRKTDPANTWYARQSRYRLDAELVRDNALAISGLLSDKIGGPSVKPYQPAGYWRHMNFPVRSWQNDSGEALYRRGLYTWWQRMFLHPGMLAFDAPSREECTVERPRSNTPQQALVLLNDITYVEAARALAERVLRHGGKSDAARLNWVFQQAVSRDVQPNESAVLQRVLQTHRELYAKDAKLAAAALSNGMRPAPKDLDAVELATWTAIARVILNLHETITRT
ncbi:MAG: PSD1 and planctomycete cytochrome C domain-containing protein [Planctomycetota bacterium]|nr:PSD1 and planctomycete cytochrome C domain-containing protein [Planctomycetota bacterium]